MSLERFERARSKPAMEVPATPAAGGLGQNVLAMSKKAGLFILKKFVKGALAFVFLYVVVYIFHEMQAQGLLG